MKLLKTLGVVALAGLVLAGCASVAHIEKDDTVNFASYKTFVWVDKDQKKGADLVENNIRKAVNAELGKEGWREVKHRPDVLLSYDVLVERGVKEQTNPVYSNPFTRTFYNPYSRRFSTIYYPSQFLGYDRDQYEVREGTVTITMIDAKTDKTIWQGWTTDEVNSKNLTSKEIQASVRSIFRKFDVAKN
jgi:hypothetical protein